jgi:hypothetical protein
MSQPAPFDLEIWCELSFAERRERFVAALKDQMRSCEAVQDISIERGSPGREYDLTAVVQTDVGRLRTPLWSHARAIIFCDPSIHPANRLQFSPEHAVAEAAERLLPRLAVPYKLESRGLTLALSIEDGVERTWTAEHSRFKKRTAVTREDRVENAGEIDVRDLLAHFYVGPALRLVSETGEAFLLPESVEGEGGLVTLCSSCDRWSSGGHERCPACGSEAVDTVMANRPPRR